MGKLVDLTGKKFGRLTVIKRVENDKFNKPQWMCVCNCGNKLIVGSQHLKSGNTRSCGCLQKDIASNIYKELQKQNSLQKRKWKNLPYNATQNRLYSIWRLLFNRCYSKRFNGYKYYGKRGITVYNNWFDFEIFFNWAMSNGYQDNLTLDRININGNYEPSNCRWVTMKEQAKNKSNNVFYTYKNETKCLRDWVDIFGCSYSCVRNRLQRGWSFEDAIFKPNQRIKAHKI